jgi:hypothetical protein
LDVGALGETPAGRGRNLRTWKERDGPMSEGEETERLPEQGCSTGAYSVELAVDAVLTPMPGGRPLPTLTVTTWTWNRLAAFRRSRALAFWVAAQAELMLEKVCDSIWAVGVPRRTDLGQTEDGWRTRWSIHLMAPLGAKHELAMRALQEVVSSVTKMFKEQVEQERSR